MIVTKTADMDKVIDAQREGGMLIMIVSPSDDRLQEVHKEVEEHFGSDPAYTVCVITREVADYVEKHTDLFSIHRTPDTVAVAKQTNANAES